MQAQCMLSFTLVRGIINDQHLLKLLYRSLAPHSRFLQSNFRYQNKNEN